MSTLQAQLTLIAEPPPRARAALHDPESAAFLELLGSRAVNQFDCLFAEALNLPPTEGLAHVVADSGDNGVLEHGHGVLPRGSLAAWLVRATLQAQCSPCGWYL